MNILYFHQHKAFTCCGVRQPRSFVVSPSWPPVCIPPIQFSFHCRCRCDFSSERADKAFKHTTLLIRCLHQTKTSPFSRTVRWQSPLWCFPVCAEQVWNKIWALLVCDDGNPVVSSCGQTVFYSSINMFSSSVVYLLWFLATPGVVSSSFCGTFVPPQTTPSLVEGDIAVPAAYRV